MNNDNLGILLRHLEGESIVWVELKTQICMKINDIILFRPIKNLRIVKGVKDFQMSSNKKF